MRSQGWISPLEASAEDEVEEPRPSPPERPSQCLHRHARDGPLELVNDLVHRRTPARVLLDHLRHEVGHEV